MCKTGCHDLDQLGERGDVRYWHKADIKRLAVNVRFLRLKQTEEAAGCPNGGFNRSNHMESDFT